MIQINYEHEFTYLLSDDEEPSSFPGLLVQLRNPGDPELAIDLQCHVDTGAEYSVLGGAIATALGFDLLAGVPLNLLATTGAAHEARLHPVVISHDVLGDFPLAVAFLLGEVRRNLLGRDFLNLVQIGFQENSQRLLITPQP